MISYDMERGGRLFRKIVAVGVLWLVAVAVIALAYLRSKKVVVRNSAHIQYTSSLDFKTYKGKAPIYPLDGACYKFFKSEPLLMPDLHSGLNTYVYLRRLKLHVDVTPFANHKLYGKIHQVDINIMGSPLWKYTYPNWLSITGRPWKTYEFKWNPPLLLLKGPGNLQAVDAIFCDPWDKADGKKDMFHEPAQLEWEIEYATSEQPLKNFMEWFRYKGTSWGWPSPNGKLKLGTILDNTSEGKGYNVRTAIYGYYFYPTLSQDVWLKIGEKTIVGGKGVNTASNPDIADNPVIYFNPLVVGTGDIYIQWGQNLGPGSRTFAIVFGVRGVEEATPTSVTPTPTPTSAPPPVTPSHTQTPTPTKAPNSEQGLSLKVPCVAEQPVILHTGADYAPDLTDMVPPPSVPEGFVAKGQSVYKGSCREAKIYSYILDKEIELVPSLGLKKVKFKIKLREALRNDNPLIKLSIKDKIFYTFSDEDGIAYLYVPASYFDKKPVEVTIKPYNYLPKTLVLESGLSELGNRDLTFIWGDLDNKGDRVSSQDYAIFLKYYLGGFLAADADLSGKVWIKDYAIMISNLGEK